jgi:hypothetical protein
MHLHPAHLETLVRSRTEMFMYEADQERLANAATCRQARTHFARLLRHPRGAAARPQIARQAGCY